jgi:A/G-specific adenine glycosylase
MRSPLQMKLLRWYEKSHRQLPWRAEVPDPYHVLVSEFMLQQTQVATVIPYFERFLSAFPTLSDLAEAKEQAVLCLWQGLGYYSRGRNLLAAAKKIVAEFGGRVPSDAAELIMLPGVGRYTAGAIASIAYGKRTPILDGNVARVLCRLNAVREDPRDREVSARLWKRAEEILPANRVGEFNSALMELGAMVCTPRIPKCGECPVRKECRAFALRLQEGIPLRRMARKTTLEKRWTFAIESRGRWLIQKRPAKGRWANMWQFVTVEANGRLTDATPLLGFAVTDLKSLGDIQHTLTHRRYEFRVYTCRTTELTPGKWVTLKQLARYPLPKPHVLIARMLANRVESTP